MKSKAAKPNHPWRRLITVSVIEAEKKHNIPMPVSNHAKPNPRKLYAARRKK